VTQVAAALRAHDLGALHAEADIYVAVDGARDLVVERGPAFAPAVSLVVGKNLGYGKTAAQL
jgi:hypothetical protein